MRQKNDQNEKRFHPGCWCVAVLLTQFQPAAAEVAPGCLTAFDVRLIGEIGQFASDLSCNEVADELNVVTIVLRGERPAAPPRFSLEWSQPSIDIAGIWTPLYDEDNVIPPDWSDRHLESTLTRQAPVLTLFGHDDGNRLTFAVSDAMNPLRLSARIREEDARIYHAIEFFTEPHPAITEYTVEIRIDTRPVPFYEAIAAVAEWWASMPVYEPADVPDAARQPMYSTWYSYHQSIDSESLLAEVDVASKLGFGAIIVDDGWQTTDANRGYAFTGDWQPERLTDIEAFVNAVHARGMKALLWYSLPFVGENSEAAKQFDGKYLRYRESLGAYVLDPRYPDVRRFLIDHYVRAVRDWGWDGLKLDFIDQFVSDETTELTAANGRDHASVYAAVDTLMTEVIDTLTAINPEVMIEFRQRYTGPAMRKYGNLFRATDIPNGAVTNRFRVANLRFLSGETAVHSDMFMWHPDEPAEVAALQFLNVLFSVPQLSVRLNEIPESHLEMIRHYTAYWNANRAVLLSGDFAAFGAMSRYPLLQATLGGRRIVAAYADRVIALDEPGLVSIDVVNAKRSRAVMIDAAGINGLFDVVVLDCFGEVASRSQRRLNGDVHRFEVPPSGLITLRRSDQGSEPAR